MKSLVKQTRNILQICILVFGSTAALYLFVFASFPSVSPLSDVYTLQLQDTSISAQIKGYLDVKKQTPALHYPLFVKRFYNRKGSNPVWIKSEKDIRKTWEAMLMLDCVLQYGLSHDDYHPKELVYDKLHQIFDQPGKITTSQKAMFDVLLTDAMLTFINHLHYGKLNPAYTNVKLDADSLAAFRAEKILANALSSKDFMSTIVDVQPKSKQYVAMQSYMRLLKGQYLDDCYEVPEADVRKVAINMERLRWIYTNNRLPARLKYLTCEMREGLLVKHDDIYLQDKALEMALYNVTKKPVVTKKPFVIKKQQYNQ